MQVNAINKNNTQTNFGMPINKTGKLAKQVDNLLNSSILTRFEKSELTTYFNILDQYTPNHKIDGIIKRDGNMYPTIRFNPVNPEEHKLHILTQGNYDDFESKHLSIKKFPYTPNFRPGKYPDRTVGDVVGFFKKAVTMISEINKKN